MLGVSECFMQWMKTKDPLKAKVLAIKMGIKLANDQGLRNIIMETDSQIALSPYREECRKGEH